MKLERIYTMKKVFQKIGRILFCLLPLLLAFAIQLIVSFAGVFLKAISVAMSNPDSLSDISSYLTTVYDSMDSNFFAGVSAIYAVIAALAIGFWYWKKFAPKKTPKRKLGQIINLNMFAALVFLMAGMQYLSSYIVNFVSFINPRWYKTYEELMNGIGFDNVTLVLGIYAIIIAPISEELIFRGVTMGYAAKIMPFWVANIFQAFLFGLFHGNVVQGTYAFVVGLFCGYVCYRGGSIYLSILFHMLFNLWGTFMDEGIFYNGNSGLIHFLIFLLTIAVASLGFYLYGSGVKKREAVTLKTLEPEESSEQ